MTGLHCLSVGLHFQQAGNKQLWLCLAPAPSRVLVCEHEPLLATKVILLLHACTPFMSIHL